MYRRQFELKSWLFWLILQGWSAMASCGPVLLKLFVSLFRLFFTHCVMSWNVKSYLLPRKQTAKEWPRLRTFSFLSRWLDRNKWRALCFSKTQITSSSLTRLPRNFCIFHALYRGGIMRMFIRFAWFCFYWALLLW